MAGDRRQASRQHPGISGWCALAWLALLLNWAPAATAEPALEYRVKAAYLYHFLQFVTWPQNVLPPADAPLRVCVIGDHPFDRLLDDLTRRRVHGRPLEVLYLEDTTRIDACQLAYIGSTADRSVAQVLQAVQTQPVLTVSDARDFAARGGVIGFIIDDERVRLEVNLQAARDSGLQISAKLLELARIVP